MKVLVTGAEGLLGAAVCRELWRRGHRVRACGHTELDVADAEAALRTVARERPDWVVNCAAFTDVDGAERRHDEALRVNGAGAGNVALASRETGSALLHVSTDYVFDGSAERPYRPDDAPAPLSVYGRSKLEGEERVRDSGVSHLIVRTSWLYGAGGGNFVDTIRRLAREREELEVVTDQRSRPTRVGSLARTIADLLEADDLPPRAIVHAADGGTASWFELAREIVAAEGLAVRIRPTSTEAFGRPARRPAYSVLDLSDTEAVLGRGFPCWRDELRVHLGEREASA